MDKDKEKQEVSIIGRLLSMQTLLLVMGIFSLVSGIITGEVIQLFWGIMIICGSVLLYFVRKKDWKKHWEEQEMIAERYRQRQQEVKEQKEQERKEPDADKK
jgi:amino acid permease